MSIEPEIKAISKAPLAAESREINWISLYPSHEDRVAAMKAHKRLQSRLSRLKQESSFGEQNASWLKDIIKRFSSNERTVRQRILADIERTENELKIISQGKFSIETPLKEATVQIPKETLTMEQNQKHIHDLLRDQARLIGEMWRRVIIPNPYSLDHDLVLSPMVNEKELEENMIKLRFDETARGLIREYFSISREIEKLRTVQEALFTQQYPDHEQDELAAK